MNIYTKEEAFIASLEYFKGDELAARVWIDKYALKDSDGNIYEKTPDNMHWRLTKEIARIELNYTNPLFALEIYELLKDFKYIVPQGGPMAGIGNDFILTSLSNCFVIAPSVDSYGGIMKTDQEQVQLMKRRGGVGHDLSNIRAIGEVANGMPLGDDMGVPLYMERFSNSTREVAQDGRRGALMLSLDINHPDADKFIDKKVDTTKVTGANISVKIDDPFMKSLIHTHEISNNHKLWGKIANNAHKSAEPGILFWDTILKESPARGYGDKWKESSTNPCGEIPLCPYDSCRLLALNLYSYVEDPFTDKARFDFDLFVKHSRKALRIMDDIIDLEIEKLDKIINKIKNDPEDDDTKKAELDLWVKIRQMAIDGRRTGIGVTAEGDMLAALGLQYGSDEAINFSEEVHKRMAISVYKSSIDLAKQRGCFPDWNYKKDFESNFINRITEELELDVDTLLNHSTFGRRNIACLTIAPTGTTSLMTQTSSGIEPAFLPYYKRRRKTLDKSKATFTDNVGDMWEEYTVFHHKFKDWIIANSTSGILEVGDFNYNGYENKDAWCLHTKNGDIQNPTIDQCVLNSPYYKSTANDIDYIKKVQMQGRIQKWVDHSISVTVNMHKDVTVDDVSNVYKEAWKSGCKGVTVYRDGSRAGVLVSNNTDNTEFKSSKAPKRPKRLHGRVFHTKINGELHSVIIGMLKMKPIEVFCVKGRIEDANVDIIKEKKGVYSYNGIRIVENMSDDQKIITRLISLALRHGADNVHAVEQISKVPGPMNGFAKAIARCLKQLIKDGEKASGSCQNCGGELIFENGCKTCHSCGWSACG